MIHVILDSEMTLHVALALICIHVPFTTFVSVKYCNLLLQLVILCTYKLLLFITLFMWFRVP